MQTIQYAMNPESYPSGQKKVAAARPRPLAANEPPTPRQRAADLSVTRSCVRASGSVLSSPRLDGAE